ncbi:hypothetical protein PAPHI01_1644 [Pancytospora philotis]|nr:hypothetical protein PAPHI01_1644 [Pancytospora philotis]
MQIRHDNTHSQLSTARSRSAVIASTNFAFQKFLFQPAMAYLSTIYKEQSPSLARDVEAYVASPRGVDEEIHALKELLADPSFEKLEAVFCIEVLSQTLKKQQDFTAFMSVVLDYVEANSTYKNSVFILRVLRNVINTRFYLPTTFYLVRVMQLAIEATKLSCTKKHFSYDDVRLSSDDLKTEELQIFVVNECLALIRRQVSVFGSSIGFPEYAFVVCNELRNRCKVGIFKETAAALIKLIVERKAYIEAEREKAKIEKLSPKSVADFERDLAKWTIEL